MPRKVVQPDAKWKEYFQAPPDHFTIVLLIPLRMRSCGQEGRRWTTTRRTSFLLINLINPIKVCLRLEACSTVGSNELSFKCSCFLRHVNPASSRTCGSLYPIPQTTTTANPAYSVRTQTHRPNAPLLIRTPGQVLRASTRPQVPSRTATTFSSHLLADTSLSTLCDDGTL